MSFILLLIFISVIYSSSGWSYNNYNNRFLANRYRNVISVPMDSIYPRINDIYDSEDTKCVDGMCVPHDKCENGTILRNKQGVIANRVSDSVITNGDEAYCKKSEKCCKFEEEKETHEDSAVFESNEIPKTSRPHCGRQNYFGIESRISDGVTAEYGEFPWMIIVLMNNTKDNSSAFSYKCGGSLIHPSVVLTAAHCVDSIKPRKIMIRAGDWDISNTDEAFSHQDRDVRSVVIHKGFSKPSLHNDIALLILTTPVELTENINTICLPPLNAQFDDNRCFISGWGKDSYGASGVYQSILKKVEVPIISSNVCQRQLRHTLLGRYFRLHRSFICAGGEIGDSCKGDGGSPLMCSNSDNSGYYQVGIVSWGIGCNQLKVPAAYVNVAGLRRWIDHEMKKRNLESNYYIE